MPARESHWRNRSTVGPPSQRWLTTQSVCARYDWAQADFDAARTLGFPAGHRQLVEDLEGGVQSLWTWRASEVDEWEALIRQLDPDFPARQHRQADGPLPQAGPAFVDIDELYALLGWSEADLTTATRLSFPRLDTPPHGRFGSPGPIANRHDVASWLCVVRRIAPGVGTHGRRGPEH